MDDDTRELYNKILNVRINYTALDEVDEILGRGEERDQDIHELLENVYSDGVESKRLAYEKLEVEAQDGPEIPMDQVTALWRSHEDALMTYIGQTFEASEDYSSLREQIEEEQIRTQVPIPRFMMKRYDSEIIE